MKELTKNHIKIRRPFLALEPRFKRLYTELCEELIAENNFESKDYLLIQQLCLNIQMFVEVNNRIESIDDCLEYYKNGSNVSGLFTLWNKLQSNMLKIYPQVGIGFKARQRMTALINNELSLFPVDPWSEMITVDV
jgi:hypothetical protein